MKIISVQERTKPGYQLAIAPGASVGSIEALRGRRIAYSPGQAQGALVLRVLGKAGLARSDVQLVELISTEFKDALGSRQVDAAPLGGSNLRRYLREYAAEGGAAIPHGVADGYSFFYVRSEAIAHTRHTIDRLAEASGQQPFDAEPLFDRRFEEVSADAVDEVLIPAGGLVKSVQ